MTSSTAAVTAWEALFRAQVSVLRTLNAKFPPGQLSFTEYDVLFNLSRQSDRRLRMRELGEHLLLTQPSVSRLVDRLAARQLIVKTQDPDDARGVIVTLTDQGFDAFRVVARQHTADIVDRVGGILSDEELESLTKLCDKLRLGQALS